MKNYIALKKYIIYSLFLKKYKSNRFNRYYRKNTKTIMYYKLLTIIMNYYKFN